MSLALSVSRWICLVTLAMAVLISTAQVHSQVPGLSMDCCKTVNSRRIRFINSCHEQKPRLDCNLHAFLIKDSKNQTNCIDPDAVWLKKRIQRGLVCPPSLELTS